MNETRNVAALALVHATVVGILVLLFLWPAGAAEPRNLPIGLVGPDQITSQLSSQLDSRQPGAFSIDQFSSEEEAIDAMEQKEIYGAVVVGREVKLLIATAANPNVAQLLKELGNSVLQLSSQQQGIASPQLVVEDVAALPDGDQRGAVLASSALPIVIGGISLGALAALRLQSRSARISLVTVGSLLSGFAVSALLSEVFGAIQGHYLVSSLAISALVGAIAMSLIGMHAVLGLAGFGLTAATLFLIGNPLNGVSLPVEFYPEGWGALGQLMPLGAGFELLKRINFFGSADQSVQWWVLAAWLTVGTLLALLKLKKQAN